MIDSIKIMLNDYNPKEDTISWKEYKKEKFPNKVLYKGLLFNSKFDKRKFPLRLLLTTNEKTEKFSLSIIGSIRKWYYQKNSRIDLKPDEFIDCIRLMSDELSLDFETFLINGKITELEVGITLLLKSEMRDINDCFVKYRNAEREVFEETTLYFHFENYKLVFYDKFLEINKNKILTEKEKRVFDKFHFLRFEVSAEKVSGTMFKGKFDTLEKIRDNWNLLPSVIEKYINDIVFVDMISKEKELEINSYSDLTKYFTFLGIKKYGVTKSIDLFDKTIQSSNKSKMLKGFLDMYRSNITDESDPKAKLLIEVKKKLDRLYNKSNIKYEYEV